MTITEPTTDQPTTTTTTTTTIREFGRQWDHALPRGTIRMVVSNYHVGTTTREISDNIRARVQGKPGWNEELISQAIDFALCCHDLNIQVFKMMTVAGKGKGSRGIRAREG